MLLINNTYDAYAYLHIQFYWLIINKDSDFECHYNYRKKAKINSIHILNLHCYHI